MEDLVVGLLLVQGNDNACFVKLVHVVYDKLGGLHLVENVEQAQSIFYTIQQYSNLTK